MPELSDVPEQPAEGTQSIPFVDRPLTATLATVGPDGTPHAAPVWFLRDGNDILVSTYAGTQKHRNVERTPTVSLTVIEPENEMHYIEVRAAVTIEADPAKSLPDEVVRKHGFPDARAFDDPRRQRIILRLHPTRVLGRGIGNVGVDVPAQRTSDDA